MNGEGLWKEIVLP